MGLTRVFGIDPYHWSISDESIVENCSKCGAKTSQIG